MQASTSGMSSRTFLKLSAIQSPASFNVTSLTSLPRRLRRSGLESGSRHANQCASALRVPHASRPAYAEAIDSRRVIIIDGDTIWLPGGEHVRLLEIAAPETRQVRCEAAMVIGLRAKEKLASLLRCGPVEIESGKC